MTVELHNLAALRRLRAAGRLAADTLDFITPYVKPGITLLELDYLCHCYITDNNAVPAPLNYQGYPRSICTSVNHVVCHGIPSDKKLEDGDIINIDVTVILDDYHGDSSRMYYVGAAGTKVRRLCETTYQAMMAGIEAIKPYGYTGDIGAAIQQVAAKAGYSVVKEFCGHGIGKIFHGDPQILHWGIPNTGTQILPGMCFTVEPMLNAGKDSVKLLSDGWTVVTKDRQPSAQFEHQIYVTETGYEILTTSDRGLHFPPYNSTQ